MDMASTTLDDIITELRLTYDSSVGLLEGEHVQAVPKVSVLSNLSKLLTKLDKQLQEVEQTDGQILKRIKEQRVGAGEDGDGAHASDDHDADSGADADDTRRAKKKGGDDDEADDEDANESGAGAAGAAGAKAGGANGSAAGDSDAEVDGGAADDSKSLSFYKRKGSSLTDDEDDVGLAKRRKLVKRQEGGDGGDGGESGRDDDEGNANDNDNDENDDDDDDENDGGASRMDIDNDNDVAGGDGGAAARESVAQKSLTGDVEVDGEGNVAAATTDEIMPPEQRGHYTRENDTRLKNPKSEFVPSQTLPAEAIAKLGLFSESNNGLETHGKEYLKKKYGVASYPESDLYNFLPGPIPSIDFSKNKPPTNQVQFTTFQSYIESFFRPYLPEDIDFLREKYVIPALSGFDEKLNNYDPATTPFLIPKLGHFYGDIWATEDQQLGNKLKSPAVLTGSYTQPPSDSYLPKGSIDGLNDDKLYTEEISCGPLSSRLLSAILCNNEGGEMGEDGEGGSSSSFGGTLGGGADDDELTSSPAPQADGGSQEVATQLNLGSENFKISGEKSDFLSIEERLKRELKYIGIFMNLPNGLKAKNEAEAEGGIEGAGEINGESGPSNSNGTSANGSGGVGAGAGGAGAGAGSSNGSHIIDDDEWIKNKEDDEVCAELRALQRELQETAKRNRHNKKKLIPIIEEQLAYQEYCTILEDLDKQVDQAYIKRSRVKNKKKKHSAHSAASASAAGGAGTPVEGTPVPQLSVTSGLRSLLDKRGKWINNIGKLFKSPEIMKRAPVESVFAGAIESDDELDDDEHVDATESIMNKTSA